MVGPVPSVAASLRPVERDGPDAAVLDVNCGQEDSFFRESHHFDHFTATCWPALRNRLATGGAVRLWSAACSSGEEPYTLAMAMCGRDRTAAAALGRRDLKLLATDLSTDILAAARTGRYAADTVRSVPAELRAAWLQRTDGGAEVRPELRALIAFRHLNLLGEWPMKGRFDAIFCRNVMIYFDEPTKARLQARLAERLAPGGFLYLGHSERLSADVAPGFEVLGRTIFRKVPA